MATTNDTSSESAQWLTVAEGARNLDILRTIVARGQHAKIRVGGKTVSVDMQTANMLVTVYDALSIDSQVKYVAMLAKSPRTFRMLVDFGWKHVH